MEGESARRRISAIAGHFVANEDISAAAAIIPMNCSGSLNLALPRCDNRLLFARQGSNSQGSFMRQASTNQGTVCLATEEIHNCSGSLNLALPRCDNRLLFARQGSNSQGSFMRQASTNQGTAALPTAPTKFSASNNSCKASGTPLFSRIDHNLPNLSPAPKTLPRCCNLTLPDAPPSFARPNRGMHLYGHKELRTNKKLPPTKTNNNNGKEQWSPRMDVAESGKSYVLTIEIPGVIAKDIKVEVSQRNLTVVGVRSLQSWELAGFDNGSVPSFHRREILQGPYQVVWPLPNGINKDRISAQFVDGFLQVVVPKI